MAHVYFSEHKQQNKPCNLLFRYDYLKPKSLWLRLLKLKSAHEIPASRAVLSLRNVSFCSTSAPSLLYEWVDEYFVFDHQGAQPTWAYMPQLTSPREASENKKRKPMHGTLYTTYVTNPWHTIGNCVFGGMSVNQLISVIPSCCLCDRPQYIIQLKWFARQNIWQNYREMARQLMFILTNCSSYHA